MAIDATGGGVGAADGRGWKLLAMIAGVGAGTVGVGMNFGVADTTGGVVIAWTVGVRVAEADRPVRSGGGVLVRGTGVGRGVAAGIAT